MEEVYHINLDSYQLTSEVLGDYIRIPCHPLEMVCKTCVHHGYTLM